MNNCCKEVDPCKEEKINSSQIVYDGKSLTGLCISSGMSLNQALAKIDEAYIKLAQASMDVYTERFTELVHNDEFCVELKRVPYKILEVTYCGFSMPENSYQWSNKRITLNDAFCFEDGNELVVMYQAKFSGGC